MANISLSGAKFVKYGYGQVEDNHLSAPRNGQVYGQLPAASTITKLENGQFVKYDYAKGLCTLPGDAESGNGPIMMVFNEIKIFQYGFLIRKISILKKQSFYFSFYCFKGF